MRSRNALVALGCAAWAVMANLCNAWLLRPAVEEAGVLGILATLVALGLWFTAVPRTLRRQAIAFTGFALLLGTGWSHLEAGSWLHRLVYGVAMSAGMMVAAWLLARIRWRVLLSSAVVMALLNAWLPVAVWPVLTHFWVAGSGHVDIDGEDFPAAPLAVLDKPGGGQALVTLSQVRLTPEAQHDWLDAHHMSQAAFSEAAYGLNHLYALTQIQAGPLGFTASTAPASVLGEVRPDAFTDGLFPLQQLDWAWFDGRALVSVRPALTAAQAAHWAASATGVPAAVTSLAREVLQAQTDSWGAAVSLAGISRLPAGLSVDGDTLRGVLDGRVIHVRVPEGSSVVGVGAITAPGRHEALLAGAGVLTVVSLDTPPGRVIASRTWGLDTPLTNDLFIGPLDGSGRDVIYLNTTPAQIWTVDAAGRWQCLYTAPNPLFRFEAAVAWGADKEPEILTSDPAGAGASNIRYLTSYTWRQGHLVRNWRVYWPDFVNVQTFQPAPGSPVYLVGAEYGSGQWLILQRHFVPVGPILLGVVGALCVWGWWLRWQREGAPARAAAVVRRPWFAVVGMACVGALVVWAFHRPLAVTPTRTTVDTAPFMLTQAPPRPADPAVLTDALGVLEKASAYNVNLNATVSSGQFHVSYQAYGSVNPPDHVRLTLASGGTSASWYQWGSAAYQTFGGAWMPAEPVQTNMASSVRPLLEMLTAHDIPLRYVGTAYVVDETCDVYEAVWDGPLPGSEAAAPAGPVMGEAQFWFCVGRTDHALKALDIRSLSGVSGAGPMFVDTQLAFTDLNSDAARVQTPPGLLVALQHG